MSEIKLNLRPNLSRLFRYLSAIILNYLNQFRKRSNVLKKHMLLEHTRHRSPLNFFVHIIDSLASYSISKLNPYLVSSSSSDFLS
ncbi:putative transposase [Orientia tsutsugamushi str. Kato PP]|uniref:Transposase n=1 Tax=Orientia tsutsugamushi TaxID=784 RepID=A0A2U3R0G8_ORITS|nr:putative transposase [Orientia tsutsugamushi str. Kato PP]SPR06706.1 transposase [Orientia tsutsugamushi]